MFWALKRNAKEFKQTNEMNETTVCNAYKWVVFQIIIGSANVQRINVDGFMAFDGCFRICVQWDMLSLLFCSIAMDVMLFILQHID